MRDATQTTPRTPTTRLAGATAGTVIALTALIAVPAAGALGAGGTPSAASTTAVSTTRTLCGGGGQVQPFCTRLPPTSTTSTTSTTSSTWPAAGLIDFEDGRRDGWTTTNRRIRLKVVPAAAQSGRLGLRIDGFDKVDASPSNAAVVTVPESRFSGFGGWRYIALSVRLPKAKVLPPWPTCPSFGTTPNNRAKLRITATTAEGQQQTTVVELWGKTWQQVSLVVPASTGDYTLSLSREFATLDASVHVDAVRLIRLDAAPTRHAAPTATARMVRPMTHTEPPPTTRATGPSCTPRP